MHPLLSKSAEDVVALITKSEKYRKYVWTAGRIIKRLGVETHVCSLPVAERSAILRHFRRLLRELDATGIVRKRREIQSIGFGDESGYDYVNGST